MTKHGKSRGHQKRRTAGADSAGPVGAREPRAGARDPASEHGWLGRFRGRHPVLCAVVIFAVLMGAFYGFIHSPYVGSDPFQPFLTLIARSTGGVLQVLGQEITVDGTSVSSPVFSMEIVRGCDAIEPVAAFVAAVLASPVALWAKIPGILVGATAMLLINLIRIVSLYFVGVHFPKALDIMHLDVWQAAFVVLAICFWAIWVQWATREREHSTVSVRSTVDSGGERE